jgi:hypothetical protein
MHSACVLRMAAFRKHVSIRGVLQHFLGQSHAAGQHHVTSDILVPC